MLLKEITKKKAQNLIWNFHHMKSQKKCISVIYTLKDLKRYVDLCSEAKYGNTEMKIYFGQYGKNIKDLKADYDTRITPVFVPVKDGRDNLDMLKVLDENIYDEGELCPPLNGCDEGNDLYNETLLGGFDPTKPDT